MRKFLTIILSALCLLCSFCFTACQKGPIPNGKYADTPSGNVSYYTEDDSVEFYWEIKGDTAKHYTSRALDFKAKIVEKDGYIYFEGYKWKSLFSSIEMGSEDRYIVEYNETENSITVHSLQYSIELPEISEE